MGLDQEDINRLKEIFVTRQECDLDMDALKDRVNIEFTRLAVIEHRLSTITWILMAVGTGIITMIIKMFWGA